jgi:ribulose-phosphate 3-epimerase
MPASYQLQPSILACDFTQLGEQIRTVAQAGLTNIHIDVMDGRFVPNISIGIPILQALRPLADELGLFLDTHLMIVEPEKYISAFAQAGADLITVHVETCPHLHRTIQMIKEAGVQAGVALNPATPTTTLEEILPDVDQVLVMSVNPGFGGQTYIPASTNKIRRVRHMVHLTRSPAKIQVDGGINPATIRDAAQAGAELLVAGSAIFAGNDIPANIEALHQALREIK